MQFRPIFMAFFLILFPMKQKISGMMRNVIALGVLSCYNENRTGSPEHKGELS